MGCNSIINFRGLEKFLYRVRCKWENEISDQAKRAEDKSRDTVNKTGSCLGCVCLLCDNCA